MIDPVGPMVQQTFTIRLHVYACYTKSSKSSRKHSQHSQHSRAWHIVDQCLPASQITCRLGVPSAPVSGQHEQAYSPYRRTQNERHSAASVQIKRWIDKTRWLGPRHITRKQQCLAWVRMSAPEYHTSTLTHAQFAASHCAISPPQFQVVATCHRGRAYVPLVACRSGEHLLPLFHGPIVAAESARYPALSPITAKLLSTDRVSKTIDELPAASTSTLLAFPSSTQPV